MAEHFTPGWDMRAITTIARERFDGLRPMFDYHGWPWPGARWLAIANARIVEEYGSIAEFRAHWNEKADADRDGQ